MHVFRFVRKFLKQVPAPSKSQPDFSCPSEPAIPHRFLLALAGKPITVTEAARRPINGDVLLGISVVFIFYYH